MHTNPIEKVGEFDRPTPLGNFHLVCYRQAGAFAFTLVKGSFPHHGLMVRVQSPCLFGESFLVNSCDCGEQLSKALKMAAEEPHFLLVYLAGQEGRGHGILKKIKAIQTEVDRGVDMVEAFNLLKLPLDLRDYRMAADIVRELNGDQPIRLLTNNPKKLSGLQKYGVTIAERLPLVVEPPNEACRRYLLSKKNKMGHLLPDRLERLT